MNGRTAVTVLVLALCVVHTAPALAQFGGKPLATQTIDGDEVSVMSVERKQVFRDQFGQELRATDGQQWIVVRMQFRSPGDVILHEPLAVVDAAGRGVPPEGPNKIHWISERAPGARAAQPKPAFEIPMESTVLFPVGDGSEPKTLKVGKFTFEIAGFLVPPPAVSPRGAVVRGRVLAGRFVGTAKPLADTPLALVAFPQAKGEKAENNRQDQKNEAVLFLEIAHETRCDEEGRYAFHGVAPGTYLLSVTATIGNSTGPRSVTVDGKDAVIEILAESDIAEVTVLVDGNEARRTMP